MTEAGGSDFGAVAVTDSDGRVWAAWQAFRDGNYDILLAQANADGSWKAPQTVSNSKANDWSPAIAADSKGRVFVAWDTYDRGNYDVRNCRRRREPEPATLAGLRSLRRPAPPGLRPATTGSGSAYEEGDEQWGKDYANDQPARSGPMTNLGFPST